MSDGSTSAAPGVCKAEPGKTASALAPYITDFLNFCRIEKGLAANSLDAYRRDPQRYSVYFEVENGSQIPVNHTDTVLGYLNSLYRSGLARRSTARHLASFRNTSIFRLRSAKTPHS